MNILASSHKEFTIKELRSAEPPSTINDCIFFQITLTLLPSEDVHQKEVE